MHIPPLIHHCGHCARTPPLFQNLDRPHASSSQEPWGTLFAAGKLVPYKSLLLALIIIRLQQVTYVYMGIWEGAAGSDPPPPPKKKKKIQCCLIRANFGWYARKIRANSGFGGGGGGGFWRNILSGVTCMTSVYTPYPDTGIEDSTLGREKIARVAKLGRGGGRIMPLLLGKMGPFTFWWICRDNLFYKQCNLRLILFSTFV